MNQYPPPPPQQTETAWQASGIPALFSKKNLVPLLIVASIAASAIIRAFI